jgi:equilibrative nucleoside transporter 1/2/3
MSAMERIRSLFAKPAEAQEYTPLAEDPDEQDDETPMDGFKESAFSWLEYTVFLMLGIAMLWSW